MSIESQDLLPRIKAAADYGVLKKEYEKEGLTVKVYTPDLTQPQREKKDIEIREKVRSIIRKQAS